MNEWGGCGFHHLTATGLTDKIGEYQGELLRLKKLASGLRKVDCSLSRCREPLAAQRKART
jgi:hypothetical protein